MQVPNAWKVAKNSVVEMALIIVRRNAVDDPSPGEVVPGVFDPRVVPAVASAVAAAARAEGVARA